MNTFTPAEVFFLISSVGFVILWILVGICLVYLIRVMHTFSRILDKLEDDVEQISDTAKDIFLDIKDNAVFKFLFGRKRKSQKVVKMLK